jgi:hypothetical protein
LHNYLDKHPSNTESANRPRFLEARTFPQCYLAEAKADVRIDVAQIFVSIVVTFRAINMSIVVLTRNVDVPHHRGSPSMPCLIRQTLTKITEGKVKCQLKEAAAIPHDSVQFGWLGRFH